MLMYWVWHCVTDNILQIHYVQKPKWQLLSATKSYTSTLETDVLQMTNNDATNYTTTWQQTSTIFLGCRALYANYPFSLLDSWREFKEILLESAWLAMQCKLLHLLCCSQLYILCLPKSPKHKQLFTRFSHSEGPLSCVNVALRYCFNHCITIFDSGKSPCRRPGNISQWTKDNKTTYTAELRILHYI